MTTVNSLETATGHVRDLCGTAATRALFECGVSGSPSKSLMQGLRDNASDETIVRILRDAARDASVNFGAQVDAGAVFETPAGYVAHAISVSEPDGCRGFANCYALVLFGVVDPADVVDILNKTPGRQNFVSGLLQVRVEFGAASTVGVDAAGFDTHWCLSAAMRVARRGGPPADPSLVLAARQTVAANQYDACRSIAEYIDDLMAWTDKQKIGLDQAGEQLSAATEKVILAGHKLVEAVTARDKAGPERTAQKLQIFSTAEAAIMQATENFCDGFEWSNYEAAQGIVAAYDQAARDVKQLIRTNWHDEFTIRDRRTAYDSSVRARDAATECVTKRAEAVRTGATLLAAARLAYANTPSTPAAVAAAEPAAVPIQAAVAKPALIAAAPAEPAAVAAAEPAAVAVAGPAPVAVAELAPVAVAEPATVPVPAELAAVVAELREMLAGLTALLK